MVFIAFCSLNIYLCRVSLKEKSGGEKLHSVGYKNIAISDKHVNQAGDVLLFVR